jgi:hypothetical protein
MASTSCYSKAAFAGFRYVLNCFWATMVLTCSALGQQSSSHGAQSITVNGDTIVVTGTAQPVSLAESDRPVVLIENNQNRLFFNSLVDYRERYLNRI